MCRLSEAELNWVRTKIRRMSACRQPLIGTSMRRYLPPIGTAGFERVAVRGNSRVPCPPPRMIASVSLDMRGITPQPFVVPGPDYASLSAGLPESEEREQLVGEGGDERRRGDRQDPRPHNPAGDAPADGRQPPHRTDPDDSAGDRVGGADGD